MKLLLIVSVLEEGALQAYVRAESCSARAAVWRDGLRAGIMAVIVHISWLSVDTQAKDGTCHACPHADSLHRACWGR